MTDSKLQIALDATYKQLVEQDPSASMIWEIQSDSEALVTIATDAPYHYHVNIQDINSLSHNEIMHELNVQLS